MIARPDINGWCQELMMTSCLTFLESSGIKIAAFTAERRFREAQYEAFHEHW